MKFKDAGMHIIISLQLQYHNKIIYLLSLFSTHKQIQKTIPYSNTKELGHSNMQSGNILLEQFWQDVLLETAQDLRVNWESNLVVSP